mmetsp:Transcript_3252/g.7147  ORF Transcript_3252/g.7147 Transcript_3252/m.7147 type:complete len:132 (-) Transcript_3252:186-581(-)
MVFNGAEAFKGEGPALERELSVTSTSNRVLLDSKELNAASGAFNVCCAEAYAKFADLKRQRIHPGKMTKERDAVESCSADVYKGIQSLCSDQLDAVKACLSDNPDSWAKCAAARRDLDVCSVRNGLGEIKK